MKDSTKVAIGAGAALALLYWSASSSASETPKAEPQIQDAPKPLVEALGKASYQEVPSPAKGAVGAILAMAGVEDGQPSALAWVRQQQTQGMVVIASVDLLETLNDGALLLSLSEDAARALLGQVKTFYRIPKV